MQSLMSLHPRLASLNTSQKAALAVTVLTLAYLLVSNILRDYTPPEEPRTALTSSQDLGKLLRIQRVAPQPHTIHLVLYGSTEANRLVKLKAQIESQVVAIPAKEGAAIRAGDTILKLDVRDREAKVQQATALVAQRKLEFEASEKLNKTGVDSNVKFARTKAAYEEARAMLASAKEELEHTVIRAPFDGVLERVTAEIGDLVGRGFVINGDDSVATVVDDDPMVVVGMVPQQRRQQLETGQPARIKVEGAKAIAGTIRYLGAVTDPNTRTFRVEVEVANPDHRIPVGVSAELNLPAGETMAYEVAPSVLSLDDKGGIGVKTVNDKGIVHFQPVTILEDSPEGVWISGIEGQGAIQVITLGHNYVSEGQQLDLSKIAVLEVPEFEKADQPADETAGGQHP